MRGGKCSYWCRWSRGAPKAPSAMQVWVLCMHAARMARLLHLRRGATLKRICMELLGIARDMLGIACVRLLAPGLP